MFFGAWCGGLGAGGWLLMVAFWVVFLGLAVWAVMQLFPGDSGGPRQRLGAEDPKDVLDRRLAAGEIDVETYRRLQQELRASIP